MSSSYSAGSATSSSGGGSGQQLGARPKIARQLLLQQQQQQQMNKSVNRSRTTNHHHSSSSKENKEWNSNWNSILSAQGDLAIKSRNINGQPPSIKSPSSAGRDGMSSSTTAVSFSSDPSLAVIQPVQATTTNGHSQKSPELFHSHHYHARRQRDRQHFPSSSGAAANNPSRSNSAADLSRQSSTINLSSNASSLNNVNNIKDSNIGGISNIWARWFKRNNNRTSAAVTANGRPFSSSYYGAAAGSRSHSVENSPVVSRRRHPMTGSSGQLASDNSDSLSTNSFSFIRVDPALTLRRKYGLMACSNESTDKMGNNHNNNNNIEGDAIRAMRTQWETQMKQMDEFRNHPEDNNKRASHQFHNNSTTSRKKRPAPQPPASSAASSRQSTNNRASSVTSSGFTHVPGKRKAPSPPSPTTTTTTFNIVVPPTILPDLMTTPESSASASAAGPLTENNKWSNDLNCNLLLDENNKVFRYHQNKFEDCPHNDILKLEGGVLRPLDSSSPSNKSQQQQETTGSTMDSNHRGMMTLPLKPWYKRGRNNNGNPAAGLHHQHSSANAATRSKWKDAALLHHHHPAADECSNWAMGLVATHVQHLHPPPELNNTIRSNYSSTVSPGGSTKSEGSVCSSSDGSKSGKQQQQQQHRKSLLVNISQLDREATEIIQRERARESQRRRMEDEKFYCGTTTKTTNHLATVPDVPDESPPRDPPPPPPPAEPLKCARELINMFNSLTDISAGPGPSINSQQTKTAELQLEEKEKADANYKTGQTYSSKGTSSQTVPTTTTANGNCSKLLLLADDQQSTPKTSTVESMNSNTITRLRVNRETVPAGSPTTEQQQQQQSIFNPKLEVGSGGGARPKHSPSTLNDNKSALVKPTTTTTTTTNGWACQVCTLVNSDARLWCEACTALKPRQINRTTTTTTPVVKETVKIIPKMPEVIPSSPSIHSVTTPNSPEALRQARLAFFLNNGQNNNNNNKTEIENTKRLSQHVGAAVKVSSSCQTQPILATPKLNVISQRPVSIIGNPISDNCPINVNNSHNNNKRVVVPAAVFKDVNPTNFALLSPSRTQLSQYLQQQQQQASKQQQQQAGSTESDVQKSDESSDEFNEDKKVELMLLRLEEAIAAGQFDKAAVLAKELAAIKRTPSPAASPPSSIKPVEVVPAVPTPLSVVPAVIPKPVAAPRSVVPVVVQEKQSDPVQSSAMNDVPLPAKRLSHLTSPSPLPRKSIRPEEKPEVKLKEEESPIQQLMEKPVEEEIIRPAVLETAIVPVKKLDNTPEVTVRTKRRSVKVSSGQQTTLTFQKKSNPEEMNHQPRRTQSCIVDDTFNVEFFIEDRSTHSGPFHWPVRPSTTLLELKERTAKSHNIKVECQRWILGRRLADQDQLTLKDYDICPSNSSLFLYVLNDPVIIPKPKSDPNPPIPTTTQPTNARRYYNYEEDRYSTCEEDEDEPLEAAGQHINGPVIINKDPPTLTETDEKQQPETTADQGATGGGTDEPIKIDYKKLVDLLDVSDVVTNADSFDCPVCLMTVPAGVGVTLRECLHNFCRDCLAHVIEFSDEATVTCPYRDDNYVCDAILQEIEIKNLVGVKLYEKHLERSMRLAEKTMKNTFHCQTADCPGWAVIEEDNVNVFRCPVCRKNNCLTCQAIHEGANCKEFQDRVNQSADTDEDAKRTKEMIDALVASGEALNCPQCQVVLMKRWGCDWVRCSVCRTEICWVTKQNRWGPKGKGDTSGGCRCGVDGVKCHPLCNYCH